MGRRIVLPRQKRSRRVVHHTGADPKSRGEPLGGLTSTWEILHARFSVLWDSHCAKCAGTSWLKARNPMLHFGVGPGGRRAPQKIVGIHETHTEGTDSVAWVFVLQNFSDARAPYIELGKCKSVFIFQSFQIGIGPLGDFNKSWIRLWGMALTNRSDVCFSHNSPCAVWSHHQNPAFRPTPLAVHRRIP